jgi:hypothetical protein
MISITSQHNEDRLNGTKTHIERGAASPKLRIYGTPRPASASASVGAAVLLAEFIIPRPIGTVSSNELVLAAMADAVVLADGTALWARCINGDGNASFDCDCSGTAGIGEVKLLTTSLIAGATLRLASAKLT